MKPYGDKKLHTHVAGHQNCGDCHPSIKNKLTKARREDKREIRASGWQGGKEIKESK